MKYIWLTQGKVACVSDQDFSWLNKFNWYAQNNGGGKFYAARCVFLGGKKKVVLMHREILKNLGELDGEHRNGCSLDNRRRNLRPATRSQNHANRKVLPDDKTCPFRGVYYNARHGHFTAQISIENRKIHLGTFQTAEKAALAYDKAASLRFGKFATLNFLSNYA